MARDMVFAGDPGYASIMTDRTGNELPDESPPADAGADDARPDETAPTTVTPKSTRSKVGDAPAIERSTAIATPEPVSDATPRVVNIERGGIDVARAERVSVNRGGITTVDATTVDLKMGGISRVEARDVSVMQGGIALARADRVTTQMSAVALAVTGESKIDRSFVRAMFARDVTFEQGGVWNLAAGRVTFKRPSLAGIVIAGRVDGEVRTILDWRGAIAFGAVAGILVGLLRRR
jgi:hypothetical protein